MGIMDAKLVLSDAQGLTTCTRTASTNFIDLGAASLYIGVGTPLYLNIRVNTTMVGGGESGTALTCHLMDGAHTSGVCTGSTLISRTVATSLLAAGKWIMRVPLPFEGYMRFLRLRYVNSSEDTAWTAGKVDSWISGATPDSNVGVST